MKLLESVLFHLLTYSSVGISLILCIVCAVNNTQLLQNEGIGAIICLLIGFVAWCIYLHRHISFEKWQWHYYFQLVALGFMCIAWIVIIIYVTSNDSFMQPDYPDKNIKVVSLPIVTVVMTVLNGFALAIMFIGEMIGQPFCKRRDVSVKPKIASMRHQ